MNLSPFDYRQLISNRCDTIRSLIWEQPRVNNGWAMPAPADEDPEVPPKFAEIHATLNEIGELLAEFERSIGPA